MSADILSTPSEPPHECFYCHGTGRFGKESCGFCDSGKETADDAATRAAFFKRFRA